MTLMLVDRAIEMFEECIASDAGDFDLAEVQDLLTLIKHAPAYDVGGVDALLCAFKKKGNYASFMDEVVQHPGTVQSLFKMGPLVWMEGIGTSNGFLLRIDQRSQRTALCLVDVEKRGFVKFVRSDADMIWYETKAGKRLNNAPEYILDVLMTTAYLASEPKTEIVVVQQGREEKRNKRGTKVLKAKRRQVHTIIIDGVSREVVNGMVTYKVHSRGWHTRRHKVSEHLRHYSSGRVIVIHAHERGNAALGFVPWFEGSHFQTLPKHYKVKPDLSFYPAENAKAATPQT